MFCWIHDKNLIFLLPGTVSQGLKAVGFVFHLCYTPAFSLAYLSIIKPALTFAWKCAKPWLYVVSCSWACFYTGCLLARMVLRILFLMEVAQSISNTSLFSPARLRYSPFLSFQFRNTNDNMQGDNVLFFLSNSVYLPSLWLSQSNVCEWCVLGRHRDCLCHALEKHHGKKSPFGQRGWLLKI